MVMVSTSNAKDAIDVLKFNSAIVAVGDKEFKFDSGWYLSEEKAKSMAKGTQKLTSSLKKEKNEKAAYVKAYNSAMENTEKFSKLLEEMYAEYDRRVAETDKLIANYNEQIRVLETKNKKLKKENTFYKSTTVLFLVGGVAALCN